MQRQLRGHAGGHARPATRAGRGSWLLLREFRKATRFTRPGVDGTLAVRELARGRSSPRRAAARGQEGPARRLPGEPRRTTSARPRTPPSAASARAGPRRPRWPRGSGGSSRPSTRPTRGAARAASAPTPPSRASPRTALRGDRAGFAAARRAGRAGARRLHRRALHRRGAGPPRRPADPLRRADPGRLRPRHRGRQGHDPVRDPGVDGVHGGVDLGLLRPRGGPQAARRRAPPQRVSDTLERLKGYVEDAQDGKRVVAQDTMESTQEPGQRRDRRAAARRVEAGRRPGRLRPDQDHARPDGGRGRRRRVRAGRAVAPRGLRVLRVRPRAEPAHDRAGRRRRASRA